MRKLTILVDMDDTLVNLCETWVEYINEKHGTSARPQDIKEWDMTKSFPTLSANLVYSPLFDENMWKRVKPLPGAAEYIKKLIFEGHKVVVVTASHPDTVAMKLNQVLFKYFPILSTSDVIISPHKQMILGDVLVDDAPHNLINGKYKGILFNAPHNRGFQEGEYGLYRASNWHEAYIIIRELSDEKFRGGAI